MPSSFIITITSWISSTPICAPQLPPVKKAGALQRPSGKRQVDKPPDLPPKMNAPLIMLGTMAIHFAPFRLHREFLCREHR